MAYEQRPNSGTLFKNKKKQPGDRQPDYRGDCEVNGFPMEISAWIKDGRNGGKFMSLAFKPKQDRQQPEQQPMRGIEAGDVPPPPAEDSIPF